MGISATTIGRRPATRLTAALVGLGLAVGLLGACTSSGKDDQPDGATGTTGPTSKVVTTPVPAPGGGNISETIPPKPMATQTAVPLSKPAAVGKVTVSLVKLEKITVKASGPGEIGGPAVAVTVKVANGTDKAVDGAATTVNLLGKDGSPALPTPTKPAAPISGSIAAGGSAQGVYVFTIKNGIENPVTVQVTYAAGQPIAQFTGNL